MQRSNIVRTPTRNVPNEKESNLQTPFASTTIGGYSRSAPTTPVAFTPSSKRPSESSNAPTPSTPNSRVNLAQSVTATPNNKRNITKTTNTTSNTNTNTPTSNQNTFTANVDNNLPPTSPKLTPSNYDPKVPSPYEERSFRLRTLNSPPRSHRTPPQVRISPQRAMTAPRRLRVSPYKNNSFKLKRVVQVDDDCSGGGVSGGGSIRRRGNNNGISMGRRRIHLAAQPPEQISFHGSLQDPDNKALTPTTSTSNSFSRRSLLFSAVDSALQTTPTRSLDIPFFDPKIAGSKREDRKKVVGTFEAIFAGRNKERSPSSATMTTESGERSGECIRSASSTNVQMKAKKKTRLRTKVKVAFETTQRRVTATVTGATKTTFPNSSNGIFGSSCSSSTSICFSTSTRSPAALPSRIKPPSFLPTSPLATAAKSTVSNDMESLTLNPEEQEQANSKTRTNNTENNLMFFKTGVLRHNLLDVNDNLVELKNTMTVTGRTAIKRVFPELKNGMKIEINGQNIALYRSKDIVYAVGTECPHRKGPLHLGDIEDVEKHGLCVVCPWHRWTFRLTDGLLVKPDRGDQKAIIFPVEIDEITDEVSIGFEQFDNNLFNDFDDDSMEF
jgi:nitrite reductase/ring-hydroxylating ferredoxin subunit